MHAEQRQFCERIRARFPHLFCDRRVLDCGSLDVNGNNRSLFTGGSYHGIDLIPGNNVDQVSRIHEFRGGPFNTIICTEALEHDQFAAESIRTMIRLLTADGLLLITCATSGRPEHGTHNAYPESSPATHGHYRNIEPPELTVPLSERFLVWAVEVHHSDLYAWAIGKK